MATIHQWKIETFLNDIKLSKKTVEAKETAKQYRVTELSDTFFGCLLILPKGSLEVITTDGLGRPIYSSLDPDENIALAKLKEWYEFETKRTIESLEEGILEQKSFLEKVKALEVKGV